MHESPFFIRVVNGIGYATSYSGNHYDPGQSDLMVFFNYTKDGRIWQPVNASNPIMYKGGVSEVGWTFDDAGNFYAVMRNEDGDRYILLSFYCILN